jgi:hypothetical protein
MCSDQVRFLIEQAFANTPYPGDNFDAISVTGCDDGLVAYFRGTSWRGHSPDNLREHAYSLPFFTDAAYRYWLPAFMLAELDDHEIADIIATMIAIDFSESAFRERRLAAFSQEELEAIASFLRYCEAKYGTPDYRNAAENVERRLDE